MKSYHFSCGNSSKGPVGFCARLAANSREEAAEKLTDALESIGNEFEIPMDFEENGMEYVTVYFGPIKARMVDEIDEIEDAEEVRTI